MHRNRLGLTTPLGVLATLALLALPACATPFGFSISAAGGADRVADGDQIYFETKRVKGLGTGTFALTLPADWKERPTHPVSPGFAALDEPVVVRWEAGMRDAAELDEGTTVFPHSRGWFDGGQLAVYESRPLDRAGRVFESPDAFRYQRIHGRLLKGRDAYVVVPSGGHLKRGFDVYGATGPPIVWVHLAHVDIESGESVPQYWAARSIGAVAWGLDQTMACVAFLVAVGPVGPFGGLMVLTEPLSEYAVETPW